MTDVLLRLAIVMGFGVMAVLFVHQYRVRQARIDIMRRLTDGTK